MERKISDDKCPVRKSMQIFTGKWTLLIIFQINRRIIRYGELKRAIPGISEKMLIDELKFLCGKGLVTVSYTHLDVYKRQAQHPS
ncbi:helix-turn-helix transcriptional regulator [Tannerella forsythia]|uniref:winged helix-turn-helix transcriptional regulator n=1 Tax=Tannerella forsythia TaxID=28112 RepID=UPI00111D8DDB|nr:helix-turn-helix domain-containing protein [Tannerella forsythia]TPE17483.1 helix-turn-helix transcriptional regulator [Tannerella forsythia]